MTKAEIEKNLYATTREYESYFEHLKFMFASGALKKSELINCVKNVYNSLNAYLNTVFEQNIIEKNNGYVKIFQNLLINIKDYLNNLTTKKPKNLYYEEKVNRL